MENAAILIVSLVSGVFAEQQQKVLATQEKLHDEQKKLSSSHQEMSSKLESINLRAIALEENLDHLSVRSPFRGVAYYVSVHYVNADESTSGIPRGYAKTALLIR